LQSPIRIVLVDDHELFRAGMRALLEMQEEFHLVGEAASADASYPVIERERPDVVLMDLRLAGVDGIAAVHELRRRMPRIRVMMLSGFNELDMVTDALGAGAQGYLLKTSAPEDFLEGIRRVHRGEIYLSPEVPPEALERHRRLARGTKDNGYQVLSRREKEVFALLVRGWSNTRVGQALFISVKTVESHREHILKKLGLHSIVELVRFAARQNLLG
jgi:DNA-binding NarL/FixJ family response regulator